MTTPPPSSEDRASTPSASSFRSLFTASLLLAGLLGLSSCLGARRPEPAVLRVAPVRLDCPDPAAWGRLPGVGPSLARRIVTTPLPDSPRPEDLLLVPGVGTQRLNLWMPWLRPKERASPCTAPPIAQDEPHGIHR